MFKSYKILKACKLEESNLIQMLRENKEGLTIDRIMLMGLDKWNSLNKLLAMQKVKGIKQKNDPFVKETVIVLRGSNSPILYVGQYN